MFLPARFEGDIDTWDLKVQYTQTGIVACGESVEGVYHDEDEVISSEDDAVFYPNWAEYAAISRSEWERIRDSRDAWLLTLPRDTPGMPTIPLREGKAQTIPEIQEEADADSANRSTLKSWLAASHALELLTQLVRGPLEGHWVWPRWVGSSKGVKILHRSAKPMPPATIAYLKRRVDERKVSWTTLFSTVASEYKETRIDGGTITHLPFKEGKLQPMPDSAQELLKKSLDKLRLTGGTGMSKEVEGLFAWFHVIHAHNGVMPDQKVPFPNKIKMRLWTGTSSTKPSGDARHKSDIAKTAETAAKKATEAAAAAFTPLIKDLMDVVRLQAERASAAHEFMLKHAPEHALDPVTMGVQESSSLKVDDSATAEKIVDDLLKKASAPPEPVKVPLPSSPPPKVKVKTPKPKKAKETKVEPPVNLESEWIPPKAKVTVEDDTDSNAGRDLSDLPAGPDATDKGKRPIRPSEEFDLDDVVDDDAFAEVGREHSPDLPGHPDPFVVEEYGDAAGDQPLYHGGFQVLGIDEGLPFDNVALLSATGQNWSAIRETSLPEFLFTDSWLADAKSNMSPKAALGLLVLPYRLGKDGCKWFAVLDNRIRVPDPKGPWNPTPVASTSAKGAILEQVLHLSLDPLPGYHTVVPKTPGLKPTAGKKGKTSPPAPKGATPSPTKETPAKHVCRRGSWCRTNRQSDNCMGGTGQPGTDPLKGTVHPDSKPKKAKKAGGDGGEASGSQPTPKVKVDPVGTDHPLREKGTSRLAVLADQDKVALRKHFGLSLEKHSKEDWDALTDEARRTWIRENAIPRWAVSAVTIDRKNLQKILKGDITKENFSKTVKVKLSDLGSKTAQGAWLELKSKFSGVALVSRPSTDREKSFRKEYDALKKRFPDDPALPKIRGRKPSGSTPSTGGNSPSHGSPSSFAASLAPMLEMAKALGQLKKALA
jgi:hypothetical protein